MPSSVINHFSYDAISKTLKINFVSGMIYLYKNVPEQVYNSMKTSVSKGKFFNSNIKDKYKFEKIDS